MELSRRFFLGGAISLVAAKTFIPSVSAMANFAKIYGNGRDDDSEGLGALFRNEPVIFDKETTGIENHDGIKFHRVSNRRVPFRINRTVSIPYDTKIEIEEATFLGDKLEDDWAFFYLESIKEDKHYTRTIDPNCFNRATFDVKSSHKWSLITNKQHELSRKMKPAKISKIGLVEVHKQVI